MIEIYEIHKIAEERGGRCLSDSLENSKEKLLFECSCGNIWCSIPYSIKSGSWCPSCGIISGTDKRRVDICDMHKIAAKFGGECLGVVDKYKSCKFKFRCSNGHIFLQPAGMINQGRWCPHCSSSVGEQFCRSVFGHLFSTKFVKSKPKWLVFNGGRLELDGYSSGIGLAFEYDGPQHYRNNTEFIDDRLYERDCVKDMLCEDNGVDLIRIPYYVKIDDIFDFIVSSCVELGYTNLNISEFVYKGVYSSSVLDEMCSVAIGRGGECLSDMYIRWDKKLKFRCSNGHEFFMTPPHIRRGQWCRQCYADTMRNEAMSVLMDVVDSKDGYILDEYINSNTKIRFKCSSGHIWCARPRNIRYGRWCPECWRLRTTNEKNWVRLRF